MADKKKRVEKLEKELDANDPKKALQIVHLFGDETEAEVRERDGIEPRESDIVIRHVRWGKEPKE